MIRVLQAPPGPDFLSPIILDNVFFFLRKHAQRIGNVALHTAENGIARPDVLPVEVELDSPKALLPAYVTLAGSLDRHAVRSGSGIRWEVLILGELTLGLAVLGGAVDRDYALVWAGARGGIGGAGRVQQGQEDGERIGASELHIIVDEFEIAGAF